MKSSFKQELSLLFSSDEVNIFPFGINGNVNYITTVWDYIYNSN